MRSWHSDVIRVIAIFSIATILSAGLSGCGHVAGESATRTVTVGGTNPVADTTEAESSIVAASHATDVGAIAQTDSMPATDSSKVAESPTKSDPVQPASETRTFKIEGPEEALRISYDDFDLLKVMNLDPVPPDAPERMPKWLKELDGKRIRVRGFMYPPFQDKDIRGFVLARDNQICCFGRTPKEYDLVDVFMRSGVTTHYIQGRPFDVVGVFKIKSEIEKFTAMYELEDAVVIEK